MGFLLPILLAVLASIIGGLYLVGAFRQRRPGEPPLDKGLIPWLGHVAEFHRDTAKFLKKMRQKHGDIFTIKLGGFYYTFIMDHLSYEAFVKTARTKLDFNKFAAQLVARISGYEYMENEHKFLHLFSNKHLTGDGLEVLTQAVLSNLQNLMLNDVGSREDQKTWIEDGLFIYSYNIVFRAGYLALFGNETAKTSGSVEKAKEIDRVQSDALFSEYRKYDQLLSKVAYGGLLPKEKMEVKRLKRLFWKTLSVQKVKTKENISGWVWDMQQMKEEHGMKESMQDRFMLFLLWSSQDAIGPIAFWLLLYLMSQPEAMNAVKGEVEDVLKQTGQKVCCGGPLINLTSDMLLKMPILGSAVEETLRLTAAPTLTKAVPQDTTFKMADGHEYNIRKGDRISLFPYTTVQMDPELHPDPLSFKYDRFLNPDGTKKKNFYKAGNKVKYFNMPWGSGDSMCPGRFFATNQLKLFVFIMLTYFDFELKNHDGNIPDIDKQYCVFGSLQPSKNIQFRYRLRF